MESTAAPLPIDRPPCGLSPGWKGLISLLVALHVAAVFVGPWAMPPHGSELARTIAAGFAPYLQAAFLDNGYRFFAPEPGPGHLVRYEIVTRDGRTIEGSFPDRKAHWPRLLYHRHFMLSEFLNSLSAPEAAEMATAYEEAFAGHLAHRYDAESVKLYLQQHRLPTMAEVRSGKKLGDPEFYDEHLVVEYKDKD
jgi:hypothetical protein